MAKRAAPEVNAGSMADIAFLLLIFFLVTTTIEVDSGITSKLPPEQDDVEQPEVRKKNVFQVIVNSDNQLLVQDDVVDIKDLSEMAQKFLDNGGGTEPGKTCSYCQGDRDPDSSENPQKAVISLFNDRLATYSMYATVLNELVKAYNVLRDREALSRYGESYTSMVKRFGDWPKEEREEPEYLELQEKMNKIAELYPRNLSEGEPTKN